MLGVANAIACSLIAAFLYNYVADAPARISTAVQRASRVFVPEFARLFLLQAPQLPQLPGVTEAMADSNITASAIRDMLGDAESASHCVSAIAGSRTSAAAVTIQHGAQACETLRRVPESAALLSMVGRLTNANVVVYWGKAGYYTVGRSRVRLGPSPGAYPAFTVNEGGRVYVLMLRPDASYGTSRGGFLSGKRDEVILPAEALAYALACADGLVRNGNLRRSDPAAMENLVRTLHRRS